MQFRFPCTRSTGLALAAALTASLGVTALTASAAHAAPPNTAAAPYLYLGWGHAPDPTTVMSKTGIETFTLAFVLSDGTCNPTWDGSRPLAGGVDAQTIKKIRAAGGDVIPSIGGWGGTKLAEMCTTPEDLAGAYGKLVDAYDLTTIDIDIENTVFQNDASQDRVLRAVTIFKQNHPDVRVIMTMGTGGDGPNARGRRLISRAAALKSPVDVWTIMPFDFGGTGDMGDLTVQASEGLHAVLLDAFGKSDDETYRMQGISSMNGTTDSAGEGPITVQDFQQMRSYATEHHLARLSFWSVNRDRPCTAGESTTTSWCSGIDQQPWDFTKTVAKYQG